MEQATADANCSVFKTNQNYCLECNNGYKWDDGTCVANTNATDANNCAVTETNYDSCLECKEDFYLTDS